MYTVEDIMKMLDSKSEQDVAAEFTKTMNEAIKRRAEEKAAAEKKLQEEQNKKDDAKALAASINRFMRAYYPSLIPEDFTGEEIITMLDSTKRLTHSFKSFMPGNDVRTRTRNADDVLKDWLKNL